MLFGILSVLFNISPQYGRILQAHFPHQEASIFIQHCRSLFLLLLQMLSCQSFYLRYALFRPASHDCSFVNRAIKDKKLLLSLHLAVISLKNSFFNYSLYYFHLYNLYYKSVRIITFLLNFFSLQ